ncbi:MAG: T9SS type A sorting domain-containing protein [Owenweeksia sp.]
MKHLAFFLLMLASAFAYAQNDSIYFNAYPNPFQAQLNIDIDSLDNDTIRLRLLDMTGQVVAEPLSETVLNNSISLVYDGDTLPEGVYILNLNVNHQSWVLKVLKIKNLGVDELEGLALAQMFPNPATNKVNIRFGESVPETVKITDLQGKMILIRNATTESLQIDISGLSKGHYLLHLVKGPDQSIRHLIKL